MVASFISEWTSRTIPSRIVEPNRPSRDLLEQDKQLLRVLQQYLLLCCWTCSSHYIQLPLCRTLGTSVNGREDPFLQTWSPAIEEKEDLRGEGCQVPAHCLHISSIRKQHHRLPGQAGRAVDFMYFVRLYILYYFISYLIIEKKPIFLYAIQ